MGMTETFHNVNNQLTNSTSVHLTNEPEDLEKLHLLAVCQRGRSFSGWHCNFEHASKSILGLGTRFSMTTWPCTILSFSKLKSYHYYHRPGHLHIYLLNCHQLAQAICIKPGCSTRSSRNCLGVGLQDESNHSSSTRQASSRLRRTSSVWGATVRMRDCIQRL